MAVHNLLLPNEAKVHLDGNINKLNVLIQA